MFCFSFTGGGKFGQRDNMPQVELVKMQNVISVS